MVTVANCIIQEYVQLVCMYVCGGECLAVFLL